MLNELTINVEDVGTARSRTAEVRPTRSLVPVVDGVPLTELVAAYEASREFDVVGGYGGIVPDFFNFGDLSLHYLGVAERQWPGQGMVWLLGCDCGEVGCWPLEARVNVTSGTVVWSAFRQPHRPDRDYWDCCTDR